MAEVEILEVQHIPLDEWLELLRTPPKGKLFVRNMFPSDAHRDSWLKTAHSRPDNDVKMLLRHFLVSTGSNPKDELDAAYLLHEIQEGRSSKGLTERDRRLILHLRSEKTFPVWEGLGWVIDLLPQYPRMALNVIDAFFHAYWDQLTDNYLSGLFDAQSVIRNRYIESANTADVATKVLLGLDWRELEWLCGYAYAQMGYDITVTPRGNDDGVDVFARNPKRGQTDLIVIQAKKWSTANPVGKGEVRELLGTIDLHRATKGVFVTTGRYESGSLQMAGKDSRIELLGKDEVLQLLNEHCGADWFTRVDRIMAQTKRQSSKEG